MPGFPADCYHRRRQRHPAQCLAKISDRLEHVGHDGRPAETALAALRLAESEDRPFAVALLDCSMAGFDEPEVGDNFSGGRAGSTPLVLMTGLGQLPGLEGGSEPAAGAWLSKPIREEELLTSLRIALALQPAEAARTQAKSETSWTAGALVGRVLFAGDNLINGKVAIAMLSSVSYRVDTVIDGAAAVAAVFANPVTPSWWTAQMPVLSGYEAAAMVGRRRRPASALHRPMTAAAGRGDLGALSRLWHGQLPRQTGQQGCPPCCRRRDDQGELAEVRTADRGPGAAVPEVTLDKGVMEDLASLDETLGDGFLADLIGQFLRETPQLLNELREALEAGDDVKVGQIRASVGGSVGSSAVANWRRRASASRRTAANGRLSSTLADLDCVEQDFEDLSRTLAEHFAPLPMRVVVTAPGPPI